MENPTLNKRIVKDRLFAGGVFLLSMVTISPIVLIIYKLVSKGYRQINFDFFSKKAPDTYEAMVAVNSGEIIPGGILNGITGTLFMVMIASAMAIPIGLLIGIFLYDQKTKRYAGIGPNRKPMPRQAMQIELIQPGTRNGYDRNNGLSDRPIRVF